MTKVRIGNDIRLKIQLTYGGTADQANILSAQAFFVNTTLKKALEDEYKKKSKFIGRFPIKPFVDEFNPDDYNINSTGHPRYHTAVVNQYNGFGLNPDWKKCAPIADRNITVYRCNVVHTEDPKVIIVTFPASAQKFEGEYELVITANIFDSGYETHSRTVTANYKSIFELVSDSQEESVDNPVQIEINNASDPEQPQDIYIVAGTYDNDSIKLRRNDFGRIDIDVSPITGWYEGD